MEHGQHTDALFSLVAAVSAGIALVALAHRLSIPAIVLLLFGGVILGPVGLNVVRPTSLEHELPVIVSLSVALILFEGGLTLNVQGYRQASGVILRLLSIGVATTWFATTAALIFIAGVKPSLALLAASLTIVTGPTVIIPLLKRIKIRNPLHSILHWEAVLIDPIGVFVAILCFEWVVGGGGSSAIAGFLWRVLSGLAFGVGGGLAIAWLIRRRFVEEDLISSVPVGAAILVFGLSELIAFESGLLATTVAGLVLGASRVAELQQIRVFKAAITDLLIGILFILLAARLEPRQFMDFGWHGLLAVAVVIFLVRALTTSVSTLGEAVTWRERLFLSWVAPRGIVAASMASLFAIKLAQLGVENARLVETFTYCVIVATIVLQGSTAGWLARRLGLTRPVPNGWLIVGANLFARRIGDFIRTIARVPVVLLDLNPKAVAEARVSSLPVLLADARDAEMLSEHPDLDGVGNLLCLTDNEDLNSLLCHRWSHFFGRRKVYCWHSKGGTSAVDEPFRETVVWPSLPKPSLLSADLDRHRASLIASELSDPKEPLPEGALLVAGAGEILLPSGFDHPAARSRSSHALVFKRWRSPLVDALHPSLFLRCGTTTLESLLRDMMGRLVEISPKLPGEGLCAELIERERAASSAIGHGVAIPHTYSKATSRQVCALAQLSQGLRMGGLDDTPVRLVFLVIGPPGDPQRHLAIMADIARIVAAEDARSRLLSASSFDEILEIIRTYAVDFTSQ